MGGAEKRPNNRHTIPIYIDVFDNEQSISLSALWNEANEAIVILRDTGAGDAFVGGFLASLLAGQVGSECRGWTFCCKIYYSTEWMSVG